jgi:hypothetical protein
MIKFELLKVNQEAVVEKITAKHLESVIDVIKEAPPCSTVDGCVEFMLTNIDAEALNKEIAIIASELESGFIAGNLWRSYDYISDRLRETKED